ncbi:hypothetical protein P154DRAFT_528001 [Amniculicola lignicola CBS 123094]|uniref:CTLH domain-containing protein n=1 Tax=Amniculicola lignicola CBS 123094 TaxID=1392246 RepID=A0A6A5VZ45_9PLEO|nr:hypothetical protein P154DRAFT_528001 [Amniculicola lignicola CBS 123094]
MSSSTVHASAAGHPQHPFLKKVDDIKPNKSDMNFVIMDYLVTEGYQKAAQKFAAEANMDLTGEELESIHVRAEIKMMVLRNDIQNAINKINDLNPQILDNDHALHFALLRLQLIRIIKAVTAQPNMNITPALKFSSAQLAPRAAIHQEFLHDLELAMMLLVVLPAPIETLRPELAELLKPKLRQDVARRVNEVILTSQGKRGDARLQQLVKLKTWAEAKAREAGKDLPAHLPLGLGDEREGHDGGEPMVS